MPLSLALIACAACDLRTVPQFPINSILFLGNSITISQPDSSLGWNGSWGMAATDSAHDFVHQLAARFPGVAYASANIAAFETGFRNFNIASIDGYLRTEPDVVVIELGDNVQDVNAFAPYYAALVSHIAARTHGLLLCVSTWWDDYFMNLAIRAACARGRAYYVNISVAERDAINRGSADRQYSDSRVSEHPGDAGMIRIADALYQVLRP